MKVIIYGLGKFAEYVSYAITNDSPYEVIGHCVEKQYMDSREDINGLPIIDFNTIEENYPPNEFELFIAVGVNKPRHKIFTIAKEKGYTLMSYVSSKAIFWDGQTHGENVWVGEASLIQPFVSIGDNCILFGAFVGHHSKIEDHTLLSACTTGGNVTVGAFSTLGMNSTVKQNVSIGKNNIIGMGCVIERNTKDNEIYHAGKSTIKRNITTDRIEKNYLKLIITIQ